MCSEVVQTETFCGLKNTRGYSCTQAVVLQHWKNITFVEWILKNCQQIWPLLGQSLDSKSEECVIKINVFYLFLPVLTYDKKYDFLFVNTIDFFCMTDNPTFQTDETTELFYLLITQYFGAVLIQEILKMVC